MRAGMVDAAQWLAILLVTTIIVGVGLMTNSTALESKQQRQCLEHRSSEVCDE